MTERVWEFLATNSVLSCCYYSVSIQFFFNRDPSVALSVFEVLCNLRLLITRVSTNQNPCPSYICKVLCNFRPLSNPGEGLQTKNLSQLYQWGLCNFRLLITQVKIYILKACPGYICEVLCNVRLLITPGEGLQTKILKSRVPWLFKLILGFHMTSPKFKLRNYRFFWVFTFMRYYSTQTLLFLLILGSKEFLVYRGRLNFQGFAWRGIWLVAGNAFMWVKTITEVLKFCYLNI